MSADTFSGLKLRSIGPALTSGRVVSFAVHPKDKSIYYVGSASGGGHQVGDAIAVKSARCTTAVVLDAMASHQVLRQGPWWWCRSGAALTRSPCGGATWPIPDMGGRREGDPHFSEPGDNSGRGGPQTGDEQQAGQSSDHLRRHKSVTGRRHREVQQGSANQQALDQQAGAWRTLRECGEQPLHMYPSSAYRRGHGLENIR
jgi:hypothetical protein